MEDFNRLKGAMANTRKLFISFTKGSGEEEII
jgi:hypothetical protein